MYGLKHTAHYETRMDADAIGKMGYNDCHQIRMGYLSRVAGWAMGSKQRGQANCKRSKMVGTD